MEAQEEEIARQEYLNYMACIDNQRDIMGYFGEPFEGSNADCNDSFNLDQQHPAFYMG